jgi:hypothetical protein
MRALRDLAIDATTPGKHGSVARVGFKRIPYQRMTRGSLCPGQRERLKLPAYVSDGCARGSCSM